MVVSLVVPCDHGRNTYFPGLPEIKSPKLYGKWPKFCVLLTYVVWSLSGVVSGVVLVVGAASGFLSVVAVSLSMSMMFSPVYERSHIDITQPKIEKSQPFWG